jgi:hypothetical protein
VHGYCQWGSDASTPQRPGSCSGHATSTTGPALPTLLLSEVFLSVVLVLASDLRQRARRELDRPFIGRAPFLEVFRLDRQFDLAPVVDVSGLLEFGGVSCDFQKAVVGHYGRVVVGAERHPLPRSRRFMGRDPLAPIAAEGCEVQDGHSLGAILAAHLPDHHTGVVCRVVNPILGNHLLVEDGVRWDQGPVG